MNKAEFSAGGLLGLVVGCLLVLFVWSYFEQNDKHEVIETTDTKLEERIIKLERQDSINRAIQAYLWTNQKTLMDKKY